jgi:hypothetical protein
MTKTAVIVLALAAFVTGLFAAYKWYQASIVQIDLGYIYPGCPPGATYRRGGMMLPRIAESGDPDMQRINEISATWAAVSEASRLNKVAAKWTAASVALSALSAIAGSLA